MNIHLVIMRLRSVCPFAPICVTYSNNSAYGAKFATEVTGSPPAQVATARSAGPRPGGFTAVVSGGGWTRLAAYSEPVHFTYAGAVATGVADRLEVGGTGRGMASRRSRGAVVPGAHVEVAAAGRRDRELGCGADRKGPQL